MPALGSKLGIVEKSIDLAAAQTAKGSALAAGDIIEAISLPKGTLVLNAGIELTTAIAGSTVLTLDVGIAAYAGDSFVDGFNAVAASAADIAASDTTAAVPAVLTAADTVDVTVASLTTTLTAGVVRVWAVVADITDLTG
jgi:hypothetical protein